jgi:hypothetical protein
MHGLDRILNQKAGLLRTKLNVLTNELCDRVRLREENLERLAGEREQVEHDLNRIVRLARYDLREPRDLGTFHQQRAQLDAELRRQRVDCWQDVVPVIRDFLEVWEALEQARARAMFLNDAGHGTA